MTDASLTAQWIDLLHCDDPRDVVHQTVASLAQGGVIGLATETVYTLAASALHAEGLARVRRLGGTPDSQPLTLLVKGAQECTDWVPGISQVGRRLAWRLWPGPLTLVFPPALTDGLFGRLPPKVRQVIAQEWIGGAAQGQPASRRDDLPGLGGKAAKQAVGQCRREDQGQRPGPEPPGQAAADL